LSNCSATSTADKEQHY